MPLSRRYAIGLVSIAGHVILLLAVVFFSAAGSPRPPPPEPIAVDIVPASEAPPVTPPDSSEGTPLESKSHGSEMVSDSETGSATMGPSRAKMTALPSLAQQRPARPPAAAGSPLAAPAGETMPLPQRSPDASQEQEQEQQQQTLPDARDRSAMMMMLPGGKTATGQDPPSNTPAMLQHDDIAALRTRLSQCSQGLAEHGMDERTAIVLRVTFKRDGRLAAPPQLLQSALSVDSIELTRIAITALERCQPFAELPADKYQKWKTLDLVVTPLGLQ